MQLHFLSKENRYSNKHICYLSFWHFVEVILGFNRGIHLKCNNWFFLAWLLVIDKVIHGKIKIFSGRTFTRHKGRSLMLCVIVCAHILTLVEPWNWFEIKCLIALKFVIRIIVIKSDVMLFTVKISFQMCHARTETSFVRCFVELSLFYSISFFFK